ncbi:hypothetical protein RJT09_11410 [Segatella copri]|jgi:hypothetical protein|uniref:hypothetical protein n=1 Tax=Segatella copri TaxID=165179 RepID=UPI0020642942|nr:hypothetical protein [Segatella copri]MDV3107064.1 hypothetical protein [Segatella copri]DAM49066.1 MAG TPA: hypothetical protein [Caudoviricetes sp.]
MEQKDIDIYEILKDEEYGTELYTPICGKVWHSGMANDKDSAKAIWTEDKDGREHFFDKNGKIYKEGEVLLFPSNEMRDWSKFFKKGDVLVHRDCDIHVIFEGFKDNRYTRFKSKHYLWKECFEDYNKEVSEMITFTFRKASDDEAHAYINTLEKHFGGKLNRETLEIEKPEKLTFEIGKLYVFDEEDEDGKVTVIGKLIGKEEGELTIGNQYEIENENFVTNETFFLNISLHKELREATENEVELFNKHCAIWEKKEKEAKEQPAFKPFDKVLVRSRKKSNWVPAFFVRDRGENYASRYTALPIHSGIGADFAHCIPYEGNENIAFTDYDIENLPF